MTHLPRFRACGGLGCGQGRGRGVTKPSKLSSHLLSSRWGAIGVRRTHLLTGSRRRLLDQLYPTAPAIVFDWSVPFSDCSVPFSNCSDSRFRLLLTFRIALCLFRLLSKRIRLLSDYIDCSNRIWLLGEDFRMHTDDTNCSKKIWLLRKNFRMLSTQNQLLANGLDCRK